MIPYWPDDPDTYTVPPELAHIVAYDKEVHALRLISSVTAKEARSIFERDTIPENEFNILKKIIYRFVDYCAMGYVRVPHEIPEFVLDFSHGDYVDDERNRNLDDTGAKLVALRRRIGAELWSVTVMLVNGRKESPVKANRCIFQAKLKVSSENNDFVFAESNPHADTTAMDSEEQSLDLLYRHKKIYGTGLGTSVSWDINASGIGSIYQQAEAFKLAYERCMMCINQNGAIILPIPAMVNSAFSVELFLKAVIKEKTSECRSHKLSDLFNRLPIEIQQEIMNETNHSDFETQIERFSDAFVDFRYIYEDIFKTKDLNLKFWEDFSSAIYKIVPTHIARKGAPLYIDPSIK